MQEIIRSVKPYWFYLICEGIKGAEIGKSKPTAQDWNKIVNLYCSKDKKSFERIPKEFKEKYRKYLGKIGARFVCNKIEDFHQFILEPRNKYEQQTIDETLKLSCLSFGELCEYLNERDYYKLFYIWHISNLIVYDEPRELSEFYVTGECDYKKCSQCVRLKFISASKAHCELEEGYKPITRPPQSWCYAESEAKMIMNEKETLIKSLKQVVITGKTYAEYIEALADHLLTNYDLTRKNKGGGKIEYRAKSDAHKQCR